MKKKNVSKYFGCMVFDDRVMKASLSSKVYQSLRKTIDEGEQLDSSVADVVAEAMKEWAVSKGATHYTHWFQPLTGITAEKHDSFISPSPNGGLMALNDRLKLRSMVVGEKKDMVYIASEETAIRAMEPDAENIWAPAGGEPVIVTVKEGVLL